MIPHFSAPHTKAGSKKKSSPHRAIGALAAILLLSGAPSYSEPDTAAASALREHLTLKRENLAQLSDTAPKSLSAAVTAESRSGIRRLRIDNFQLISDSDRSFAGYNLGAGSWDTQIAILASAVADEFLIQAAALDIPLDALEVVFTSRPDAPGSARQARVSYPRNLAYTAYINSPASDAELEALRQRVEATSPILNLITDSNLLGHGEIIHTPSPAEAAKDQPPGLRDFLVEKREAILRRQSNPQPSTSSGLRAHARVEPSTGIKQVRTSDDEFLFLHDASAELGGYGLAPSVEQHQLGVLGTCLTHIFEIQAATREVVLDSLELKLEAELTPRLAGEDQPPPRYENIRYTIHIESPASSEEIDQLRNAVEESCPLYNLLKDEQQIQGQISRAPAPGKAP